MQEYKCTVKGTDGKVLNNYKLKAEGPTDLMRQLKGQGLYLIHFEEVEVSQDVVGGNKIRLKIKDIAVVCRQLASMLSAGVTLVKALNILYLQTDKKNIRETVKKLYESVQKGEMFSEALKKQEGLYPELMISMVEAGEGSGRLDSVMEKLAAYYEKDVRLKAKIKSALTYPLILIFLSITVVIILVTAVLPTFVTMFTDAGAELPVPTRIVMGFSNALTGYWYLFILGIAAIVFGFKVWLGTESGLRKWHKFLLKLPVLGQTIEKISATRFSGTLSTLLSSGMNLLSALEISIRVAGNRVIMDGLYISKEDIRKGMPLSQSLRKTNVLPPMVYSMVGIGEESGSMETMLEKCSEYFDSEVNDSITRVVGLIEPLLIVLMGVMIGFIVVSMLLPIFDLYSIMASDI